MFIAEGGIMSNYNFNFNIDTTGMIKVSIMRLGLIFNAETIKALGSPKKINIGLDSRNKVLGIKASEGNPSIREYDFVKKGDEKWIRVNSKQLIQAIEESVKCKFENTAKSFPAKFDENENMLIVDLQKK